VGSTITLVATPAHLVAERIPGWPQMCRGDPASGRDHAERV